MQTLVLGYLIHQERLEVLERMLAELEMLSQEILYVIVPMEGRAVPM
jgi:hypothetical protein